MEGSGSAASMRDSALPYSRRSLAAHEQVKRRGLWAFGSERLCPLLAAAVFVAVLFLVPAPCSAFPVLPVPGQLGAEANQEATNYYFVSLKGDCKGKKCKKASPPPPPSAYHSAKPGPKSPSGTPPPLLTSKPPPAPVPPSPTPPPPPAFPPPVPRNQHKLVWIMGWSFLGIALLLQVALGGFLVYRRRELQRLGSWLD